MIGMKFKYHAKHAQYAYRYKTIEVEVISNPYPLIESHYGSPPNSGLTTSNTQSTTCVTAVHDGDLIIDIPLSELRMIGYL